MVNALAYENKIILCKIKVDEKSNEITAIPKLLDRLDVCGCTLTIYAMGTQKNIAKKIINITPNYILGLKEKKKNLHDEFKT